MTTLTEAHEARDDASERPYWSGGRVALLVAAVLMVGFWGWVFLFAPHGNPDRLTTRSFPTDAEAICAPAQEAVDALPLGVRAADPQERARQVEDGTAITVAMVAELKAAAAEVTDADDLQLIDAWFADWDAYVLDRERYAARLQAADADTPAVDLAFTLTERAEGGIYTRRIDGFANVNDMASCHVPGDV